MPKCTENPAQERPVLGRWSLFGGDDSGAHAPLYPHNVLYAIQFQGNILLMFQCKLLYNTVFTVAYASPYQLKHFL